VATGDQGSDQVIDEWRLAKDHDHCTRQKNLTY
jgi:hypothetical protein